MISRIRGDTVAAIKIKRVGDAIDPGINLANSPVRFGQVLADRLVRIKQEALIQILHATGLNLRLDCQLIAIADIVMLQSHAKKKGLPTLRLIVLRA